MTLFPNRNIPANMAMTEAFNGILFETGRPAFVLGAKAPAIAKPGCVLMAWNGEPQAAKAIHQSLTLLDGSQDVRLVLVDPEATPSGINPGDEMAAFLARHRQKVTVDTIASAGREVADVLLQHAFDKDADLIVMGGYGRSRLREWLLGGTTRNLLTKSELPVFMVH
jgi:nucleotide-binding universal stress UspA family protein